MDAAFTNAIGVAVQNLLREGDAKGLLHSSDRSGELDGAALGLWGALFDCQPELFRESAHQCDRGRIGGVLLAILRARDAVFAQAFGIERVLAPDDDRNSEDTAGPCRLFAGCRGKGSLFTTGEYYALLGREAREEEVLGAIGRVLRSPHPSYSGIRFQGSYEWNPSLEPAVHRRPQL